MLLNLLPTYYSIEFIPRRARKGDTIFRANEHQLDGNWGYLTEGGFMGIGGSGRTRSNFLKKKIFPSRPQPGQARLKYAEMAYISAVSEWILKIPFFHENYNELWKILKKIFPSRPQPGQARLK